ncbi:GPR1/FUN34/yaaH family domain-containing protein [Trichoderma austrokoningii]
MNLVRENEIKVPESSVVRRRALANPSPLGYGGFATTLMTLSLSGMGFRSISNQSVFVANLCFLAGVGLLVSAQWEMVRGNTFDYTVLGAFALYYGGYGVLLLPSSGVLESYGGQTADYHNAFGIYLLVWSILNLFFFIASLPTGAPNIVVYGALELSYIFNCIGHFVRADGNILTSTKLLKVGGAFGFVSSLAGFYMLGHELCRDVLPFRFPVYSTSRLASVRKSSEQSG